MALVLWALASLTVAGERLIPAAPLPGVDVVPIASLSKWQMIVCCRTIGIKAPVGQLAPRNFAPGMARDRLAPKPLPKLVATRLPEGDLAKLQRSYRKLVELGLDEEAALVAEQIVAGGAAPIRLASANAVRYEANYRGGDAKPQAVAWADAKSNLVSLHFTSATVEDVAAFFRTATGATIKIALEENDRPLAPLAVRAKNLTAERGLQTALASAGLDYREENGAVVIYRPLPLADLGRATSLRR